MKLRKRGAYTVQTVGNAVSGDFFYKLSKNLPLSLQAERAQQEQQLYFKGGPKADDEYILTQAPGMVGTLWNSCVCFST